MRQGRTTELILESFQCYPDSFVCLVSNRVIRSRKICFAKIVPGTSLVLADGKQSR